MFDKDDPFVQWLEQTFRDESDRACAVLVAAFLDDQLDRLLRAYVRGTTKEKKQFFGGVGPLASFSARIEAAYLFGLISKDEGGVLHQIRKVRNDFAHQIEALDFGTEDIRARLRDLELPGHVRLTIEPPKEWHQTRRHFMKIAMVLAVALHLRIQRVKQVEDPGTLLDVLVGDASSHR